MEMRVCVGGFGRLFHTHTRPPMKTSDFRLPFAVCILAVTAELLHPSFTDRIAGIPFLASALFLGVPHGALDWAAARNAAGNQRTSIMLSYLALMLAAAATLYYAPSIGLLSFLILSMWHFGRDRILYLPDKPHAFFIMGRGIVVVTAPFVFAPVETTAFIELTKRLLGNPAAAAWSADDGQRALQFTFIAGVVAEVVWWLRCWRHKETVVALCCAAEMILLCLAAAILNPVFYVGLYFLCFHSWVALAQRLKTTEWSEAVRSAFGLHCDDGPLAWLSWVLIGLAGFTVQAGGNALAWAGIVVLFYATVTPAHLWLSWVRSRMVSGTSMPRRVD